MMLSIISGQVSRVRMRSSWVVWPLIQCDQCPAKKKLTQVTDMWRVHGEWVEAVLSPSQRCLSPRKTWGVGVLRAWRAQTARALPLTSGSRNC